MEANRPVKAWLVGTRDSCDPYESTMVTIYADTRNEARTEWYNKRSGEFKLTRDEEENLYLSIKAKRIKYADLELYEGFFCSKEIVQEKLRKKEEKLKLDDILKTHSGKKCRVWSGQWDAYWRANSAGYTSEICAAGIYSVEEGVSICRHVDLRKRLSLEIID